MKITPCILLYEWGLYPEINNCLLMTCCAVHIRTCMGNWVYVQYMRICRRVRRWFLGMIKWVRELRPLQGWVHMLARSNFNSHFIWSLPPYLGRHGLGVSSQSLPRSWAHLCLPTSFYSLAYSDVMCRTHTLVLVVVLYRSFRWFQYSLYHFLCTRVYSLPHSLG